MHCLNFNYSLLGVSVNVFHNLFLIFDLDMQHPVLLEKLPMSVELRISSSPCPCVHPCVCGRIHEDPLFPILPGGFNSAAEGALVGCLAVFPRHKGRTKLISILPFWLFGGVDYESLQSTIIPGGWLGLFSLVVFCLLGKGSLHISFV